MPSGDNENIEASDLQYTMMQIYVIEVGAGSPITVESGGQVAQRECVNAERRSQHFIEIFWRKNTKA